MKKALILSIVLFLQPVSFAASKKFSPANKRRPAQENSLESVAAPLMEFITNKGSFQCVFAGGKTFIFRGIKVRRIITQMGINYELVSDDGSVKAACKEFNVI